MDPRICATLPVFHALTGCDAVSSFGGRGKKTAWSTWKVYLEATGTFEELLIMQDEISNHAISVLERFAVLPYDCTNDNMRVNDARKQLFTRSPGVWRTYLQHRQHLCNISDMLATSPTAGTKP